MEEKKQGLFKRMGLFRKTTAEDQGNSPVELHTGKKPEVPKDVRVRLSNLEMDLRERDARIEAMKKEFELLKHQAERHVENAGSGAFLKLMKKLAPFISQVATMQHIHQTGDEVNVSDLLKLFSKITTVLTDAGLIPLGVVGETAPFDKKIHQRMSGGDVGDDTLVKVRFTGYRYEETLLVKAMVSRED